MIWTDKGTVLHTNEIHLDMVCMQAELAAFVARRVQASRVRPELVAPEKVRVPGMYRRLQNLPEKQHFREELLHGLRSTWSMYFGIAQTNQIERDFLSFSEGIADTGALVIGDLIERSDFALLIRAYEGIMRAAGSASLFHSYVDLRNHPNFLMDPRFSGAFLHPLLVALIAYRVGGSIRIVDARGKDAQPLTARAQDNMLHIDNTPFSDEYKVLVTWECEKASGPKGQNFVFIPGTQKWARNCFRWEDGHAWSTENASVFVTAESIDHVFAVQRAIWPGRPPTVIEVQHPDKPITTAFAAGSLVHHRYRTEAGRSRSCVIIAFHRTADNPGAFIQERGAENTGSKLHRYVLGLEDGRPSGSFIAALAAHSREIGEKIRDLREGISESVVIELLEKRLSPSEVEAWKAVVLASPTVEEIKARDVHLPLEATLGRKAFADIVAGSMMIYDKHGPLDLILYEDSHEEVRKWARNRIREMKADHLRQRLDSWEGELHQPELGHARETNVSLRQPSIDARKFTHFIFCPHAQTSPISVTVHDL